MQPQRSSLCALVLTSVLLMTAALRGEAPTVLASRAPLEFSISQQDVDAVPAGQAPALRARNRGRGIIVAYGVRVLARDDRARLQPHQTYVVRPRSPLLPQTTQSLTLPVAVQPSLDALETTFVLHADGQWWGDAEQARREIAAYREEFVLLSALGQALAATGETPTRDTVRDVAALCARLLAGAETRGARRHLAQMQRQLAAGLDDRTRGGRSFASVLALQRDRVNRVLTRYTALTFVRRPAFRS
ncbi:MAG TPA: hypothetical protein VMF13_06015 [Luteitalea sp.]|nr:hypothetical protein [Luteitalea sp.]